MHLDNPLRYGKPQTSAALLAGDGIVGLLKLNNEMIETLLVVAGRQIRSRVAEARCH
jgi:hypothetical protein